MIQQRIGDFLEIEFEGAWYYLVVLTKRVMFGGNIVFAYHGAGQREVLEDLRRRRDGFNICTDLLLPKRLGGVSRMHRFSDSSEFWLTRYVKACHAIAPREKASQWFIYSANDLGGTHIARVATLTREQRSAMDSGCYSFDLVARKILARYTPDQNEHI